MVLLKESLLSDLSLKNIQKSVGMLCVDGPLPLRSGSGAGPVKQPPLAERQAPAEHSETQKIQEIVTISSS